MLGGEWSQRRAYPIVEGRVAVHSVEVHVVDHCNLRCAGCCTLSPLAAKRFVTPEVLARDLAWAAAVLRPSIFKLTGGEPLLSPHVVALARLAKASGIAPVISLTTNGVLASRAPDELFASLDAMTVSIYPREGIDAPALEELRARARAHGVRLNEKRQDDFQSMTRGAPSTNDVTRAVFDGCWLRNRCHTLRDGVLFACSRPAGIDALAGAGGALLGADGISLEPRDGLAAAVSAYLERDEPLASCAWCLGGTGAFVPYRALTRDEVRARRPE